MVLTKKILHIGVIEMIDTDKHEGQIEFDDVLREIEVGVDISEGNYDILRYYRDEYKDLLAEVKRLREKLESIQNSMAWTVQVWWNENYMGREGWMEQMCEVYADLAKGIEAQYHGEEEE